VFEQLRRELEEHMAAEEAELFPACLRAEAGEPLGPAQRKTLVQMEAEHSEAGALLESLSRSTSGYDATRAMCNTHRATLAGLADLERDLHEHIHEENNILFPRLAALAPR
jgi:regulator of cell morphogenesis and NO signaling